MASAKEKTLERDLCIYYLVQLKDTNKIQFQALIDLGSEVNAMTPAYVSRLGLQVHRTNIGAQKIENFNLEIFGMVLASFQVEDKYKRARFFQEAFLLADISVEVVLGMLFLTLSNEDVQLVEKELT